MKLNLVPDYVRQRKVSKQVIALLVVLFLVVNSAMAFWMISVQGRLRALQEERSRLEIEAQQVDSLYNQGNQLIDSAAIALGKTEWVKRVQAHNLKYPELYSEVGRYTSPRVRYDQMQVTQGNQLQLAGYTRSIRELGLFLQTMYQCPLFTAVSLAAAALPGYPSGNAQQGAGLPPISGFTAPPSLAAGIGGGLSPGFSPPPGEASGSPANLMRFQVVAYLKEPIALPTPPASVPGLNLSDSGLSGGFGGISIGR